jgi:hypothetical protein
VFRNLDRWHRLSKGAIDPKTPVRNLQPYLTFKNNAAESGIFPRSLCHRFRAYIFKEPMRCLTLVSRKRHETLDVARATFVGFISFYRPGHREKNFLSFESNWYKLAEMRSLLLLFLLLLVLASGVIAQSQPAQSCPMISIDGPTGMNNFGEQIRLKAQVTPPPTQKLTYIWILTSCTFIGDPTSGEITIQAAGEPNCGGNEVMVELKVGGLDSMCDSSAIAKFPFYKNCEVLPIDEYEATVFTNAEKARVDNLAIQMSYNPRLNGYVIMEASSDASAKAVKLRVKKIRQFILNRKYPIDRFVFLLMRTDQDRTRLWLWTPNVVFPLCESEICETL